ncbi:pilus assembly protein TadG-related protein [Photobacterium makurazakiensis]|uniref:pilus assembly protein TadG-related protein n=1 Tax=Photobacterium makurazakiensis TaxID=2910234 RepID=UPI003D0E6737
MIPHSKHAMQRQGGIVLPLTTIMLLGLLAMVGLALDVGLAYTNYRQAQTAADTAALAGTYEKFYGNTSTLSSAAQQAAADNGFVTGVDNITVTVNNPPLSGYYLNDDFSVEVIVNQASPSFFLKVLGIDDLAFSARAVANGSIASSQNCVYVLDDTSKNEKAFHISSDSSLITDCGIWVNSKNNKGAYVDSGACVEGSTITVVGGYEKDKCDSGGASYQCSSSGDCPTSGKGKSSSQKPLPTPDPLAGIQAPTVSRSASTCAKEEKCDASGCSGKEKDSGGPYEPYTVEGNKTLNPGTYCGGIHIKKGKVTFNSGVYILRGGGLRVEGGDSKATGTDVSFYNTCFWDCTSSGNKDPEKGKEWFWTMDINSSAKVTFSAPLCDGGLSGTECENPLDGILFFTDRDAPSSDDPGSYPVNRIDSSVDATLTGAIYTWNQHLKFHSSSSGTNAKGLLVSKFLEVSSGSHVNLSNMSGASTGGSPLKRVTLVE